MTSLIGKKVEVYWNLHKKCWSVRHKGTVVEHTKTILLKDVSLVVQPAGRARVLREKKKNVHAFARGIHVGSSQALTTPSNDYNWQTVSYNPYKDSSFVRLVYDGEGIARRSVSSAPKLLMSYSPVHESPNVWMLVGDK